MIGMQVTKARRNDAELVKRRPYLSPVEIEEEKKIEESHQVGCQSVANWQFLLMPLTKVFAHDKGGNFDNALVQKVQKRISRHS